MNGILCIDKPSGMTSFDVVAAVRKLSGEKKAGHAGTLDPLATGVLPVFLGRATKTAELLPNHDKKYTALLRLGIVTDTGDVSGKIIARYPVAAGREQVENVLPQFTGDVMQVPPMYSAIKVGGRRLYELARKGVQIEREARKVTVYSLRLAGCSEPENEYLLEVTCSKGTYIRTLCEDIGKRLGCGGVMASLRRTQAAGFSIESCLTLEQAKRFSALGELPNHIQSVESVFLIHDVVVITEKQAARFLNGGALFCSRVPGCPQSGYCRVRSPNGLFLGLGEVRDGELAVRYLDCSGNATK